MTDTSNIPRHVAIIMDGNGRWAHERGQERLQGHVQGAESVRQAIVAAQKHGVEVLTLYAFSTENWGRPRQEVDGLMELVCECVHSQMEQLVENGVRVIAIGKRDEMPLKVREHLALIEKGTLRGDKLTVLIALNYGSREELTRAARILAKTVVAGEMSADEITPEAISGHLYTAGFPEPDLLIRTGGEYRLSNFLLWQAAYAELWFTNTYWPDFTEETFAEALGDYARRERRYGLISKQTR